MKKNPSNKKYCPRCDTEKLIDEFYPVPARSDLLDSRCRSCRKTSNDNRMYVNGDYIPQSHPLWKPGRYKSLDDAWSHEQIERTKEGEVYAIANDAWPDWIKVGKAVDADDRCNGYQTSSPFRDYRIIARLYTEDRHVKEISMHKVFAHFAQERKGEWFKIDSITAVKIFNIHSIKELENAA